MTKAKPSKTTNRLHFEDLDHRRYEDLCHALVYPMREWIELYHIGRTGNDGGRDIRATEKLVDGKMRAWAVQCKRYEKLSPKQTLQAIDDATGNGTRPLDVFILAAACPVSNATVEKFKAHAVLRGVEEAIIWDASYVESTLLNKRKDLLFTYFGFNLREEKTNREAIVKRNLKLKKKMQKDFLMTREEFERQDSISPFNTNHVLIRDIDDETYPNTIERPGISPWFRVEPLTFYHSGIEVILGECKVAVAEDGRWDMTYASRDSLEKRYKAVHDYVWIIGRIPFDNIVVYNIGGDGSGNGPHIFCRFSNNGMPYQEIVYGVPQLTGKHKWVDYFDNEKRTALP